MDSEFLSGSAFFNMEMIELRTATNNLALKCKNDLDLSESRVWTLRSSSIRCNTRLPQENSAETFLKY